MLKKIVLTENELNRVICEEINKALIEEGWFKNAAVGAAIGLSSMMPNNAYAQNNAQNNYNYNNRDSVSVTNNVNNVANQKMSIKQLRKLFPKAYKDRNANQDTWVKNQNEYVATLSNGKVSLVGKIAASYGNNPWNALVERYGQTEDSNIFSFDLDIR